MKLTLNSKGKIVVVQNKSKRPSKPKPTGYQRYVNLARDKYHVDPVNILTEGEWKMNIRIGKDKAKRRNDPVWKFTPEKAARWQAQGEYTDRQIEAMRKGLEKSGVKVSRKEFIRDRMWETVDKNVEAIGRQLKALGWSGTDIAVYIGQQIYGSE